MKSTDTDIWFRAAVAPYTGAWIEIALNVELDGLKMVAPYTGAWIEIREIRAVPYRHRSLPTRERGLKFGGQSAVDAASGVAPYTGAWIEI